MGKRLLSHLTPRLLALSLVATGVASTAVGIGLLFGYGWSLVVAGTAVTAFGLLAIDVGPRPRR